MALEPVLFRVLTDDAIPVPIDGVVVRVYTSPADVYVTQGTTGAPTPSSGEVELMLDDGPSDYLVRLSKVGVSFPGAPFTVTVDTPPPVNELEVTAHVGETAQVITLSLLDELAAPVDNVVVRLYDDNDLFITDLVTGALNPGEADVALAGAAVPGQDYIVRWRPASGKRIQNGTTQIIQVQDPLVPPATNIFDFVIETVVMPESSDPTMCLISGYLADVSKQPIKNGTLVFLPRIFEPEAKVSGLPFPTQPAVVGGKILVNEVRAKSNNDGRIEVLLPRTSIFDIHLYGLETPAVQIYSQVYIPDQAGALLEDVLLPFVASVDMGVGSAGITVGETAEFPLVVTGSNDYVLTAVVASLLEVTSSDEDVVTATIGDDGTLFVTGISSGSATVTVSRIADTWAPRVPAIPDLVITPAAEITVTVT